VVLVAAFVAHLVVVVVTVVVADLEAAVVVSFHTLTYVT